METDFQPRNPFGVEDVPDPQGAEVAEFAAQASALVPALVRGEDWTSRWNGGIAGDAWKRGEAKIRMVGERFYALFYWDDGAQSGLIEARLEGPATLVGRYLNLGNAQIRRPWIGTIVDGRRIDGRWSGGRLEFSR